MSMPLPLAAISGLALAVAGGLTATVPLVLPDAPAAPPQTAMAAVAIETPRSGRAGGRGHIIARAEDGLFYTTARVNGVDVRFLIDTGATHVVLTAADARRVGAQATSGAGLKTAGGSVAMGWATLDSLHIAQREARNLRAAIAIGDGLPVSLLGQNMLLQFASMRIEDDRLELH